MTRRVGTAALLTAILLVSAPARALDGPDLYASESALYDAAAKEGLVVSSNTGANWANWGALAQAFAKRYANVTLAYNDIGSGAAVIALDRTRSKPMVDTIYLFGIAGVDAASRGLLAGFKPVNFDKLPASARDTDGRWFAVHQMPVVFIVNKKLAKTVPHSWADLAKPELKGAIVYPDPRSSGAGQVTVFAANLAAGGSLETVRPGIDYLAELHRIGNVLRVDAAAYGDFLRGKIPVWISFEMDGLRAKHTDGMGDDVELVAPHDGTVSAPYTISLVKGARDESAAKLW
ncbi:MAG: ABC transporter substrate-binding protein, partial [Alphaproteobacteria bacterium]|nr:ABC transporter substrate-binding protein [Alphaproteobacteria bacterium]